MGFFDFLKNTIRKANEKRDFLLEWQNTILAEPVNRLIMTEQQLKSSTIQQAENDLRIIKDCIAIVENTTKPDTFFMRLHLMIEKANHLQSFEKYINFYNAIPSAALDEVSNNYQEAIRLFLIRYFSDTFDKAEKMKTDKGKYNKYKKFYDSLQSYYCYMSSENIDYIETKFLAYTRLLKVVMPETSVASNIKELTKRK